MADTHIKIHNVVPRVQYVGNGSTTIFPFEFEIFDETNMIVYLDDTIQEDGYTVDGVGEDGGGAVTFDVAPDVDVKITLLRNVPIERVTDFQEGGTFRPKNLNDDFDRQTAFCQQVSEELSRSVRVGPTSDIEPEEVLNKLERVHQSIDNIDTVTEHIDNVDTAATNINDVKTNADNIEDIKTNAENISNINAVAGNKTNIDNVAENKENIDTAAENMTAIQDAPQQAANAATKAEHSRIWAEGTDEEVQALGGEHSAKTYSQMISPIQYPSMPTPSITYLNRIIQYVGETTEDYTQGYFYKCVEDSSGGTTIYKWESILSGGGSGNNLFNFIWSDYLLNDENWLRADTFSWQDGTVYSDGYQHLVDDIDGKELLYEEKEFIQPVLTSDGIIGGDSFAVSTDSPATNREPYKSFDGDMSTKWSKNNAASGYLLIYNPEPLKISKIIQTPTSDYPAEDYGVYTIYGSNDNSTWTQLCQTTVVASTAAEHNVNSSVFYKYYKIEVTGGHNYAGTGELKIIGTLKSVAYYQADDGHKICPADQENKLIDLFNTTGVAWYYIIDTTNTRFKLPRTKFGFVGIRDNVGKFVKEGLPNMSLYTPNSNEKYGSQKDTIYSSGGTGGDTNNIIATTQPDKLYIKDDNGIIGSSDTVQQRATQMYLYFYVGEFSKSATEQTAGLNAELFNGKVDVDSLEECGVITESYRNGTDGYDLYSNGDVVQWGKTPASSDSAITVQFLQEMSEIYNINVQRNFSSQPGTDGINRRYDSVWSVTNTSMALWNAFGGAPAYWIVKGKIAQ